MADPTTTTPAKVGGLRGLIIGARERLSNRLPGDMDPDRFAAIILSELSREPKLLACKPATVMRAMFSAAQLGLEPDPTRGLAYLIPYGNECQLVVGYKGLIQLAYRSGLVGSINARVVYEGEPFEYEEGTAARLIHKPLPPLCDERGLDTRERLGAYSICRLLNGGVSAEFMFEAEIQALRKRYVKASRQDSPWNTNPDEMRKKTVLRRHAKTLPQCAELARAAAADELEDQGLSFDVELDEVDWDSAAAQSASDRRMQELREKHGAPPPEPGSDG